MSKLSPSLKALIGAAYARPGTVAAPRQISAVYRKIAQEATERDVGLPAWLGLSTAATMTMNSPDSLLELHRFASEFGKARGQWHSVYAAELMREVGLKCIGFNGVPRTINCLNAFYDGLPSDIRSSLSTTPRRSLSPENLPATLGRGQSLWKSIYFPFDEKLAVKLAQSHPDLPVHIIESEYGCLFSDPPTSPPKVGAVGRVLTSIIGVACLRAQTGVGPQVISHVFGLRKAFDDGTADAEAVGEGDFGGKLGGEKGGLVGGNWLASDEGSIWLLEQVDTLVEAIGAGFGSSFAPGMVKSKL